jgi:hypothetical protein
MCDPDGLGESSRARSVLNVGEILTCGSEGFVVDGRFERGSVVSGDEGLLGEGEAALEVRVLKLGGQLLEELGGGENEFGFAFQDDAIDPRVLIAKWHRADRDRHHSCVKTTEESRDELQASRWVKQQRTLSLTTL